MMRAEIRIFADGQRKPELIVPCQLNPSCPGFDSKLQIPIVADGHVLYGFTFEARIELLPPTRSVEECAHDEDFGEHDATEDS